MKIAVYSDLHTEFEPYSPPPTDADVVVLAGDIGVKTNGVTWALRSFPNVPVIYVPGNHEFYGGATPHLVTKMKAMTSGTNVHVLDEDEMVIDDVRFLGATLWTDFCLFGPESRDVNAEIARHKMTDYRKIRVSPAFSRFTPFTSIALHRRARSWLRDRLNAPFTGKTVVVTHHAPTFESIAPCHRSDPLSAAYASDLSHLFNGVPSLWIHGHTHFAVDRVLHGTRILSNQKGYPDEPAADFREDLVVEL